MPGPYLMLADVGQAQQDAIGADDPQDAVGVLLIGHADDSVAVEQVRGEDGQVPALVAVDLQVIAQVADLAAAGADIYGGVLDRHRGYGVGADVALLARVDGGRLERPVRVAFHRPDAGVGEADQLADLDQVTNRLDLPACHVPGDRVIVLGGQAGGKVGEGADAAGPGRFRLVDRVGEHQALLVVGHDCRVVAGPNEGVAVGWRGVGGGRVVADV